MCLFIHCFWVKIEGLRRGHFKDLAGYLLMFWMKKLSHKFNSIYGIVDIRVSSVSTLCIRRNWILSGYLRTNRSNKIIMELRGDNTPTVRGNRWKYPFCQTMQVKRSGMTGSQKRVTFIVCLFYFWSKTKEVLKNYWIIE